MADKPKRPQKRQPPVSLSPLEPEVALGGLLKVRPEKGDEPMAKFKVGDRVQVLAEARGVKEELLGAKGTGKVQKGNAAEGSQTLGEPIKPPEFEPTYEIQFDGMDELKVLIRESWLDSVQ